MTYETEVQSFAGEYAEIYTQKILAKKLDMSPTTLHNNLRRDGGFAPRSHAKVVRYLERVATELHARNLPLKLDGVPIPLRKAFLASLIGEAPAASPDNEETPEETNSRTSMDPPMAGERNEEANVDDSAREKDADSDGKAPIIVPDGASVLDPALWESGPPMEKAGYYAPRLVEEDLRQTFEGFKRQGPLDGDDALHGWKGPSPPDDATGPESESFQEDIARIIDEWLHYVDVLKVSREAGSGTGDRVYVYASLQRCRRELLLISDFYMTPPNLEVELDDFERQQEVEKLKPEILRLSAAMQAFEERPAKGLLGLFRKVRHGSENPATE